MYLFYITQARKVCYLEAQWSWKRFTWVAPIFLDQKNLCMKWINY